MRISKYIRPTMSRFDTLVRYHAIYDAVSFLGRLLASLILLLSEAPW